MSLAQSLLAIVLPKPVPVSAPAVAALASAPLDGYRNDSWVNPVLGYGGGLDKTSLSFFSPSCRLSDMALSSLYYGDGIAAKIVDWVPNEIFRRGYCLKSESNQARAEELEDRLIELGVDKCLKETIRWARLFGGGVTLLGTNDGQDMSLPLIVERANGLEFVQSVDRRLATVQQYYSGENSATASMPSIYQITALVGGTAAFHESRCLRFEGVPVDPMMSRQLAGWSLSVLQRPYDRLKEFMTALASTSALMADASQGVFKLKDLWKQIALKGKKALQERMAYVDMTRSASHSILLDAEQESFERVATSFAGIPEVLDRYMMFLSAVTGIPVSILFGRSAAGMNATGDLDVRMAYDAISAYQKHELTPYLLKVLDLIGDVPEDIEVEWHPLWEPSDKEKADTELVEAQTCKVHADEMAVWIAANVLMPEQVAISEFGSGDGEIEIDEKALNASMKAEVDLALNPPPPPPAGPPPVNPAATIGTPNDPSAPVDPKAYAQSESHPTTGA